MNAQEMYEQAIKNHHKNKLNLHPSGLKIKTLLVLCRAGQRYVNHTGKLYGDGCGDGDVTLNIDNIKQDVLSGEILKVKNLGTGILKEICEWLEKQAND